ncbi:MAG: BRCT domain-containing protein [Planctomycetota bacterium]|nr:BRCT domain-containing protein [Planctomycetota bacterium]
MGGKNTVLYIFLAVVVFLALGAINGLLAYTFVDKYEKQRTDLKTIEDTYRRHQRDYDELKGKYDEYLDKVQQKRIQISSLVHELTLARLNSRRLEARTGYREALVQAIRDMTSNLAQVAEGLVNYYDTKREEISGELRNQIEDLSSKIASLERRKSTLEVKIDSLDDEFSDELTRLETKVNQVQQDIENAQSRRSTLIAETEIDGKVLVVNNVQNFAIINVGSRDGILPGQRFKVFHYDTDRVPQEKGFIICRTVYDYVAYAQIVDIADSVVHPLLQGDYIASPLFSRDQTIKIAVIGDLKGYKAVDEASREAMKNRLKRDIEEFGAVFSEDIDPDCTICVVSTEVANLGDEGVPTEGQRRLKAARELQIPVMHEDEFLRFLAR